MKLALAVAMLCAAMLAGTAHANATPNRFDGAGVFVEAVRQIGRAHV